MVYRIGDHTITTEEQAVSPSGIHRPSWIAFLDGDRRRWEAARSESEATGKLVISHFYERTDT